MLVLDTQVLLHHWRVLFGAAVLDGVGVDFGRGFGHFFFSAAPAHERARGNIQGAILPLSDRALGVLGLMETIRATAIEPHKEWVEEYEHAMRA
jgi:hypothetical protein